MNIDGIYERPDGIFEAYVMIQDGHEYCGKSNTEEGVRKEWVKGHMILNHVSKKPSDAPVYKFVTKVVQEIMRVR